jgi:hypothetical protein
VSGRTVVRLGVLICGVELFRRVQLTLAIYYDSRLSRLADHPGVTLSGVTSSTAHALSRADGNSWWAARGFNQAVGRGTVDTGSTERRRSVSDSWYANGVERRVLAQRS